MPTVTERSLDMGTVADALAKAWRGTLPASLAESQLVDWVLSFGEQQQELYGEKDTREWLRYRDRRNALGWLAVVQLCRLLLGQRLPMYVHALFSFGRPMRAIELALRDCERVLEDESLRDVAVDVSKKLGALEPSSAEDDLRKLAVGAIRHHHELLAQYQEVYRVWEDEVVAVKELVQKVRDRFQWEADDDDLLPIAQRLIDLQARPSAIPEALVAASLSTVTEGAERSTEPASITSSILPSIGLLLLAFSSRRDSHFEFVVHRALDRIVEAEYEKAIAPQIEAEERALNERYHGTDPFTPFDLGESPPTVDLLTLAKENQLANGRPSARLSRWRSRLLHPGWQFTPPDFAERETEASIRWDALRADSMIKDRIVQEHLGSAPSMQALVQRAFEKQWVQSLGRSLVEQAGEAGRIRDRWNVDELSNYVSRVVEFMNARGYTVRAPTKKRLETLLEKARRGDYSSLSRDDGW